MSVDILEHLHAFVKEHKNAAEERDWYKIEYHKSCAIIDEQRAIITKLLGDRDRTVASRETLANQLRMIGSGARVVETQENNIAENTATVARARQLTAPPPAQPVAEQLAQAVDARTEPPTDNGATVTAMRDVLKRLTP